MNLDGGKIDSIFVLFSSATGTQEISGDDERSAPPSLPIPSTLTGLDFRMNLIFQTPPPLNALVAVAAL